MRASTVVDPIRRMPGEVVGRGHWRQRVVILRRVLDLALEVRHDAPAQQRTKRSTGREEHRMLAQAGEVAQVLVERRAGADDDCRQIPGRPWAVDDQPYRAARDVAGRVRQHQQLVLEEAAAVEEGCVQPTGHFLATLIERDAVVVAEEIAAVQGAEAGPAQIGEQFGAGRGGIVADDQPDTALPGGEPFEPGCPVLQP